MGRRVLPVKAFALAGLACVAGAIPPAAGETTPANEATLAELRKLLPAAAAMDTQTILVLSLGSLDDLRKNLNELKSQPLTAAVLYGVDLKDPVGLKPDVEFLAKGDLGGAWIEATAVPGGMSIIKAEHITKLSAGLSKDGTLAKGIVEVKNKAISASFPFEARKLDGGKWQVFAFSLPNTGRRVALDTAGNWRLTEAATTDPLIRLYRATRKVEPKTLPSAVRARDPNAEVLAPYGQLRSQDGKSQPLAEGGRGVLLLIGAGAKYSDLLALAKDEKAHAYLSAAVLTSIAGERYWRLLPLPPISDVAKPQAENELDAVDTYIGSDPDAKDTPAFRIAGRETADRDELTVHLAQLHQVGEMPLRLVPRADTPVKHVISAVDATLRAGFGKGVILVPPAVEKPAGDK